MAISDASVLLAFTLVERVDVLVKLTGRLSVTFAVKSDVADALKTLAPGRSLPGEDMMEVVFVDVQPSTLRLSEVETLDLAVRRAAKTLLSDDSAVRKAAAERGIRPLGTAGILYAGYRKGLVANPREIIGQLNRYGYTLSATIRDALNERF